MSKDIVEHVRERCFIDGCWHWRFSTNGYGNPQMRWNGKYGVVRRFLTNAPKGLYASMTCGTRDCVNPAHIKLLTKSEYQAGRKKSASWVAKIRKASRARGKLNEQKAAEIRARALSGRETNAQIAKDYGINPSCVQKIKWGESWAQPNPFAI